MNTKILFTALVLVSPSLLFAGDSLAKKEDRQQQRIAEGIKTGELTPAEVMRLEKREVELKKQIKEERKDNGGKLTSEEHKAIEKELDEISKKIHKDKNNKSKETGAK